MPRHGTECGESAIIEAARTVRVPADQARQWFLDLETHPERYRLETHGGFAFTQGNFGEVGARFQTWERFYGVRLSLHFELTELGERDFRFRLIRPALPIWGAFAIEDAPGDAVRLCLRIGGLTRLGARLLRLPLIRGAVRRQINREVAHVKASMETLYRGGAREEPRG